MPASRRRSSAGMLAIDTNLVVRYLTADHPRQSIQARTLIEGNEVFVSTTVLLETEWVLRGVYGFPATQFDEAMRAFAGLSTVTLEDPALANEALAWMGGGMDFADAIHLAKAANYDGFVTFDHRFVRVAKKLGISKVREP
jgi:predicted nucleic acid-binding protein